MKQCLMLVVVVAGLATAAEPGKLRCTVVEPLSPSTMMFGLNNPPIVGEEVSLNRHAESIAEMKFSQGGSIPLEVLGARLFQRSRIEISEKVKSHFEGVGTSRTSDYTGILVINPAFEGKSYASFQALRKAFTGMRAPLMELYTLHMSCEAEK